MKMRTKDDIRYHNMMEEYDKVKVTCKCGHRVIIPVWVTKQICSHCGHYVYANEKEEFKEKMKQKLKSMV